MDGSREFGYGVDCFVFFLIFVVIFGFFFKVVVVVIDIRLDEFLFLYVIC